MIQRLTLEHIQPRRPNPLMTQRLDHRRLIDHLAPRDINEDAFRAHQRELLGADQAFGLRRQRQGQANEVGLLEQIFEAAVLRIESRLDRRFARLAVIDHRHTESEMSTLRQRFADTAHADNPQRLAMHIAAEMRRADIAAPLAAAHHVRQFHHTPGSGEDQGETGVGGGFGEHVRGVAQENLAPGQVIDVVVIDADRDAGDGFELRREIEQGCVEFQAGAE
ncbi:hypothetical protein D3C81_1439290 [compost metagenome]